MNVEATQRLVRSSIFFVNLNEQRDDILSH